MSGRRRPAWLIAVPLLAACAHVEMPPGGPVDNVPPGILDTRPASEAVVPEYDGPVVFIFDERISERGVESAVLVSPRTSPVEVSRGRDEIRVSLRRGWEPGRIYHVTLQPVILDLFGNRLARVETLVFSTGPAIPSTASSGTVTDRLTGRNLRGVRVEAIRMADSLVYAVPTDSAGAFAIRQIPPGEYQLRAFEDINQNRSLELFEPRDSVFVEIVEDDSIDVTLRPLAPDSTPPMAGTPTLRQGRIEIEFDDFLDPDQALDSARVAVVGPDGLALEVESVTLGSNARIFPPLEPTDTAGAAARLPARTLYLELADSVVLEPETEYVIRLLDLRNVNGLAANIEVTITTPALPPVAVALVPPRPPSRYIARRRARGAIHKPRNFVMDNGRTKRVGWLAGG